MGALADLASKDAKALPAGPPSHVISAGETCLLLSIYLLPTTMKSNVEDMALTECHKVF